MIDHRCGCGAKVREPGLCFWCHCLWMRARMKMLGVDREKLYRRNDGK